MRSVRCSARCYRGQLYVVPARPKAETMDAIVTGMILVYR